ncbi:transcription factor bHLH96-like [Asparagus officinalis]|nr:transcription factor bHLH96-like [Asparagus officinalis]
MALEAVVFQQDPFGASLKELCGYDFGGLLLECGQEKEFDQWGLDSASPAAVKEEEEVVVVERKKRRRRSRSCKNKEEVESQRMTHIAVERNRRKLMNEYLAVLRSIMPPSYVQRGDQASIVGGAINFVKELEQHLQTLEAQRRIKLGRDSPEPNSSSSSPLTDFFTFPQYSTTSNNNAIESTAKNQSAMADIEVSMIETHANLKVLSKRRPKQLLKMVAGLQNLRFTVLHLNVTTVDQMVLYSVSLKVEDDCLFKSVDDIAAAVNQLVGVIQEDSACS